MSDSDVPQSTTRRIEPFIIIPGINRDEVPEPENPNAFRDYVRKEPEVNEITEEQQSLRRWVENGGFEKKPVFTVDPEDFPEADIPEV